MQPGQPWLEPLVYARLTCDEHFDLFGHAITSEASAASRDRLYETLGFARSRGTRADQLSGGTLAKLNLGLALMADPEVLLLLDGPLTRGFDEAVPLLIGLTWLAALALAVALTYRHPTAPSRLNAHSPVAA